VLPFRTTTTFSVPYTGSGTTAISSDAGLTDSALVLFAQPACPLWGSAVLQSTGVEYLTYASTQVLNFAAFTVVTVGVVEPQTVTAISSLPYGLTGSSFPIGVMSGEPYIYKPATTFGDAAGGKGCRFFVRVVLNGNTGTPTGTMMATVRWWIRANETIEENISLAGTANGTFTGYSNASVSNWFSWVKLDSVVVQTTISATGTNAGVSVSMGWVTTSGTPNYLVPAGNINALVPLLTAPPQLSASKIPWLDTRSTALALLATNTTKAINKEGTVNCARVSLNTDRYSCPAFAPSVADITNTHPSLRYFGAMEKGAYSFVPPSQELQEFKDCIYSFQSGQAPAFDLDNLENANVLIFSDPDSNTISNLALTLDQHVEFRTTTTIFDVAVCSTSMPEFHQASVAVSKITPFTENWIHVPAVLGALNAMLPVANASYQIYKDWKKMPSHVPKLSQIPRQRGRSRTRKQRPTIQLPKRLPPSGKGAMSPALAQRVAALNKAISKERSRTFVPSHRR